MKLSEKTQSLMANLSFHIKKQGLVCLFIYAFEKIILTTNEILVISPDKVRTKWSFIVKCE